MIIKHAGHCILINYLIIIRLKWLYCENNQVINTGQCTNYISKKLIKTLTILWADVPM